MGKTIKKSKEGYVEILDSGLLCVRRKREEEGHTRVKGNDNLFNGECGSTGFHGILSWILMHFINIFSINSKIKNTISSISKPRQILLQAQLPCHFFWFFSSGLSLDFLLAFHSAMGKRSSGKAKWPRLCLTVALPLT